MRTHARELFVTALVLIAGLFLIAMACSWDIVTTGEITQDEEEILEAFHERRIVTDLPDSLEFSVISMIRIGGVEYCFVEMEVGELLDGDGGDPDTLVVDHKP